MIFPDVMIGVNDDFYDSAIMVESNKYGGVIN